MTDLDGVRVFVTGANGAVGAMLVRRLVANGAQVHALIRPDSDLWRMQAIAHQVHLHYGDLLTAGPLHQSIQAAQPEIIFNCAFPGGHPNTPESRAQMLATGLLGTNNVLSAAQNIGIRRFIHIGSSTEYGIKPSPHHEDDPVDPVSVRGISKTASTLLCRQFAHEFDFPVNILRLYSVYGPWEKPDRLVPRACKAALLAQPLPVTPPGYMHDWIYVEDVVDACLQAAALPLPPGEIYNIGSGEQHANEEIIALIESISGRQIVTQPNAFSPRHFDSAHWQADIAKARRDMGWSPKHALREGLEKSFAFWKDFLRL